MARRIELGSGAQIAQRGGQRFGRIAAALMRFTAFQIGEHGAAFERDGAAVGLDGHERLPPAEGVVALVDEPPILPVALDRLVGEDARRQPVRPVTRTPAMTFFTRRES